MKQRQLGKTDVSLTVVGFGAWAIGGPWYFGWGPQDDQESIDTIRRGLELGINWIDTAAVYGLGRSERVVAEAVKDMGDVFIATKCGMVWDDEGNVSNDLRPDSLRREVEASLKRLNVDVIDLYQIHWPDPDEKAPLETSWETLAGFVEEGMVRHIGVSNFDVALMERCRPIHPIASLQPPYNMLDREIEDDILPYCGEHGIGVVAYSPMKSGLLTGKFDIEDVAEDDWRRREWGDDVLARGQKVAEQLWPIAEAHDVTPAQISVAWVLRRPEMTSAIVGARKVWQVEENVQAASIELTEEELAQIEQILSA